jgi:hypothetical protein
LAYCIGSLEKERHSMAVFSPGRNVREVRAVEK